MRLSIWTGQAERSWPCYMLQVLRVAGTPKRSWWCLAFPQTSEVMLRKDKNKLYAGLIWRMENGRVNEK